MSQKIFLATYTITDNGHEHTSHVLIQAESQEEAVGSANSQQHDGDMPLDGDEDPETYFDYGDGLTTAQLDDIQEITPEEAEVLTRLRVVYFLDEDESV